MSIPMMCRECGEVIGVFSGLTLLGGYLDSRWGGPCGGKDKHPKPVRTERLRLLGLLKDVALKYPETCTASRWSEYVGPANRFLLWCAIVFGTKRWPNGSYDGVVVNDKWVWWGGVRHGFFGDGLTELMKKA